ncbi:MAG: hypothetical protein ACOCUW_01810 [Gemmatimonadota bacterium]
MPMSDGYEVYFRRPHDAVVFASTPERSEISLVHRNGDGSWHCALCDATHCRHVRVARRAAEEGEPRA